MFSWEYCVFIIGRVYKCDFDFCSRKGYIIKFKIVSFLYFIISNRYFCNNCFVNIGLLNIYCGNIVLWNFVGINQVIVNGKSVNGCGQVIVVIVLIYERFVDGNLVK